MARFLLIILDVIIFLYGPDTFRAREKLNSLKEKFIREVDKSGFNLAALDGEKISIDEFNKAVATQSFLAKNDWVATALLNSSMLIFSPSSAAKLKPDLSTSLINFSFKLFSFSRARKVSGP